MNGREIPYPRGRVLGGSSLINGMIYMRSQPEDCDHWSQLGNRGWGAKDVFPFFRKAKNWEGPADEVHAKGGPLSTSLTRDQPELCRAAIEAGQEMGWEYRENLNDLPHHLGDHIGWVQKTRGERFRASTARSYLRPAMNRANLEIVTNALVHRLILDGKRAVGVEFSRGGATERADAAVEVIASAGAIGSSQILQLSGIGDPDHLDHIGVDVQHELRGRREGFPGPFHRPSAGRRKGHPDIEWTFPRHPFCWRAYEICPARARDADLCRVTGGCLREGVTPIGDARRAGAVLIGKFCPWTEAEARHETRHDDRVVADAAGKPGLCRRSFF